MIKKWIQKINFKTTQSYKQNSSSDDFYQPLSPSILKKYSKHREYNPHKLFCYVPFNSMSFSFKGRALACVYNQKVELGNYPANSIQEMWFESVEGKKLRNHLSHNDLNYGCKHCKYFVEHEKFSGLKPLVFDKYKNISENQYPKVMEFELSNVCNYECVMCNGYVSSSIRKNRDKLPPIKHPYDDNFVEQLKEFIPHLEEAKFYGGEPFLIPIYYKIWEAIVQINPEIKIFTITNGSVLDDQVKQILDKGNFDIGVSLDAMDKVKLESIRVHSNFETLMNNIQYFNQYCKKRNKKLVISFTMMRINYMDFYDVIQFCNEIDAIIYVSYLKTPPQFALWNLPYDDLLKIKNEVLHFELPQNTYVEKNNKKVFKDFLNYLDKIALENKNRDESEIIPLEIQSSPTVIRQIDIYNDEIDYLSLLIQKHPDEKQLFSKLETVLKGPFNSKEINQIFFKAYSTPFHIFKKDVEHLSHQEIVSQSKNTLSKKF